MYHLRIYPIIFLSFLHCLATKAQSVDKNTVAKLNTYLEACTTTGNFSGAVLIAKGDQIVVANGYGMANYELNVANTTQTKFRIGSLTKAFTAVLVLQQVEKGKLHLAGKVTDYLPTYPHSPGDSITIHQLLSNSSGLPHYEAIPDFFEKYGRSAMTSQEYIKLFSVLPLRFKPGTKYSYSSFGYYLLGAILEQVTGKTYANLVLDNICKPLGMSNTEVESQTALVVNRASGYDYQFDYKQDYFGRGLANAALTDVNTAGAAGQLLSTVTDLQTWNLALSTNKLLTEPYRQLLFTPNLSRYGYGWNIAQTSGKDSLTKQTMAHHGGSAIGFVSYLSKNLDNGLFIVVLSNRSNAPVPIMSEDLTNIVNDRPYSMPKAPLIPQPTGNLTFRLAGYPDAKKVYVSGEFNNWHPRQTFLSKQGNEWLAAVNLGKGTYKYLFVVDGRWITDPANPTKDEGGFTSSVLTVK